ncbi:hypothetical protein DIPPA_30779 [Diplonema papillatum]|nr:hypothetical protein DIPPA_30779 [Diplonema papillatum]
MNRKRVPRQEPTEPLVGRIKELQEDKRQLSVACAATAAAAFGCGFARWRAIRTEFTPISWKFIKLPADAALTVAVFVRAASMLL